MEHIFPEHDSRAHVASPNCWCLPLYSSDSKGTRWIHNCSEMFRVVREPGDGFWHED